MTAISIDGMGLTGVLRLTWVQDSLADVLDHSHTDETSGTWTRLACPGHGLASALTWTTRRCSDSPPGARSPISPGKPPDELATEHAQVFQDAMRAHHAGDPERARQLWEGLQAIWSRA